MDPPPSLLKQLIHSFLTRAVFGVWWRGYAHNTVDQEAECETGSVQGSSPPAWLPVSWNFHDFAKHTTGWDQALKSEAWSNRSVSCLPQWLEAQQRHSDRKVAPWWQSFQLSQIYRPGLVQHPNGTKMSKTWILVSAWITWLCVHLAPRAI